MSPTDFFIDGSDYFHLCDVDLPSTILGGPSLGSDYFIRAMRLGCFFASSICAWVGLCCPHLG